MLVSCSNETVQRKPTKCFSSYHIVKLELNDTLGWNFKCFPNVNQNFRHFCCCCCFPQYHAVQKGTKRCCKIVCSIVPTVLCRPSMYNGPGTTLSKLQSHDTQLTVSYELDKVNRSIGGVELHLLLSGQQSIEYRSVTSSNFRFCISAFSLPYFSRSW